MTNSTYKWDELLKKEKNQPYFKKIFAHLNRAYNRGDTIYPPQDEIFTALKLTPFAKVKVVIIGQDPYHGPGQAHGLSFSVKEPCPAPPSLKNIIKEVKREYPQKDLLKTDLSHWAKQGVLLLNDVLTVKSGEAHSHAKWGWQELTNKIIHTINLEKEHVAFLLWGNHAQKKANFINKEKHLVLNAPHPSPLSAHRGFHGCSHFSQTNSWLVAKGLDPISW